MTDLPPWEPIAEWLADITDSEPAGWEAEAKAIAYDQAARADSTPDLGTPMVDPTAIMETGDGFEARPRGIDGFDGLRRQRGEDDD